MNGALGLRRAAFLCVVLISLVVLFAPGEDVPSAPTGTDKLVHASVFLALALSGRYATCTVAPLAVALALYAAASELIQALAPLGRDGSVFDLLTDLGGIVLGLLLVAALRRRPTAGG